MTDDTTRGPRRARPVAELVAAVGVVLSLVFVGLELRQNTAAVRGATFQALSDASASDYVALAQDPAFMALVERVYFEDTGASDFSSTENIQLHFYYMAFIRRLENTYHQHQAGVVDDRIFESYGWKDALLGRPHFLEFWEDWGGWAGVDPAFAEFLGNRL